MRTIAITVDEETLALLDDLARASHRRRSRSALVRAAVRQFAERRHREEIEARERDILRKHKKRLARQASALFDSQARP